MDGWLVFPRLRINSCRQIAAYHCARPLTLSLLFIVVFATLGRVFRCTLKRQLCVTATPWQTTVYHCACALMYSLPVIGYCYAELN